MDQNLQHKTQFFSLPVFCIVFAILSLNLAACRKKNWVTLLCSTKIGSFEGCRTFQPRTFQPQASSLNLSTPEFSNMNFDPRPLWGWKVSGWEVWGWNVQTLISCMTFQSRTSQSQNFRPWTFRLHMLLFIVESGNKWYKSLCNPFE